MTASQNCTEMRNPEGSCTRAQDLSRRGFKTCCLFVMTFLLLLTLFLQLVLLLPLYYTTDAIYRWVLMDVFHTIKSVSRNAPTVDFARPCSTPNSTILTPTPPPRRQPSTPFTPKKETTVLHITTTRRTPAATVTSPPPVIGLMGVYFGSVRKHESQQKSDGITAKRQRNVSCTRYTVCALGPEYSSPF